jgi:alpha-maltose-1-phosphate synthase
MAEYQPSASLPALPALRFEPEAFQLSDIRIMGRQSAGEGFLRAAVQEVSDSMLVGFGPNPEAGRVFQSVVRLISPARRTAWTGSDDLRAFSSIGAMHLPDPSIAEQSNLRVRAGTTAYSITGVTHTLSSVNAMRMLAAIPMAPIMPWDGLICTSRAVKSVIDRIFGVQDDYAKWKFGTSQRLQRPEMPIIPLGVHSGDLVCTEEARRKSRSDLGISDDEIVFLFLGRLSFHAKAHPFPMYTALEAVARESGKRLVILQCGWFANEYIEKAFKDGAHSFCPGVRHLWLDGRQEKDRKAAWAACDVFLSLSDNIQETFGLTLIEAMAAGKPLIATDWDGYRDMVRHGETGYLVPTIMPDPGTADELALMHAAGTLNYDRYIGIASQMVSLDQRALRNAISSLVQDPGLRNSMGEAGRLRAASEFEWKVVIRQYAELWSELRNRRMKAQAEQKPQLRGSMADQLGPFRLFSDYPTRQLAGTSRIRRAVSTHSAGRLLDHPLFGLAKDLIPKADIIDKVLASLDWHDAVEVTALEREFPNERSSLKKVIAVLAKMGLVEIEPSPTPDPLQDSLSSGTAGSTT